MCPTVSTSADTGVRHVPAVLVAALLGALLWAPSAAGHSALQRSEPAAGATLESAPAEVVLVFSERPDPTLSRVRVLDEDGEPLPDVEARPADDDDATLHVALPALPDGVYTVNWQALSAVDGHITTGAFSFGVGTDVGAVTMPESMPQGEGTRPSALAVTGRWTLYWGLALLLGAVASGLFVFRDVPWRRYALPACWTLAAAGFVMFAAAEAASAGVGIGRLLTSAAGERLVREGVALAVAGIAVAVAALRSGRAPLLLAGAATAVVLLTHAATGHANPTAREG